MEGENRVNEFLKESIPEALYITYMQKRYPEAGRVSEEVHVEIPVL